MGEARPTWLREASVIALSMEETTKLTSDQRLEVQTSYQVRGVLEVKGQEELSQEKLSSYIKVICISQGMQCP